MAGFVLYVHGGPSSHIGRGAPPVPSVGMVHCQGSAAVGRAGRGGPDGAASSVPGGVFLVSARGGSGPWGVSHTPHEGAAEGTEDLVHKGCVCRLGFRLSADGGLQLPAHRQRPDPIEEP